MDETRKIQVEVDVSVMTLTTEVHAVRRHCQRHRCECCTEVEMHLDSIQDEIDKLSSVERECCGEIRRRLGKIDRQLAEILRRLPDTTPAHISLTAS